MASRSYFKQKKKTPPITPLPVTTSQRWKDKLVVAAWLVLPLVAVVSLVVAILRSQWRQSIDFRLSSWQQLYQLDDATVARLKEMELEFHGSGNPLTTPTRHVQPEVKAHHEQMASLMGEQQGKKFLHDLGEGRLRD